MLFLRLASGNQSSTNKKGVKWIRLESITETPFAKRSSLEIQCHDHFNVMEMHSR
jgi:hypothetical protein